MRISFAATNPCHLFPLAKEFHLSGDLGTYHSGYPRWKLDAPDGMPVNSTSARTLITYGLLRLPHRLRPKDRTLFRWQDAHFDHSTSQVLASSDAIHGIPGQCRAIFRRARQLGARTILNHATGPSSRLVEILRPEFERVGLAMESVTAYDSDYLEREREEYELADYHCVASSLARRQLIEHANIPPERIWTIPYAADCRIFHPPVSRTRDSRFRIIFAGQLSLRKGIRFLLEALEQLDDPNFELHCYGGVAPELQHDLASYRGATRPCFYGAVTQQQLAEALRAADALVLPSLEEGFGLVVPQALSCGLPCIVSDAVGASDLIRHRENGSVFPSADARALSTELIHWQQHPKHITGSPPWADAADKLREHHREIL